jgi:hypothetical protein
MALPGTKSFARFCTREPTFVEQPKGECLTLSGPSQFERITQTAIGKTQIEARYRAIHVSFYLCGVPNSHRAQRAPPPTSSFVSASLPEAFPADRIGLVTSIGERGCCA